MELVRSYANFNGEDKMLVKQLRWKRWKNVGKTFIFSFALPFLCAGQIVGLLGKVVAGNKHLEGEFDSLFFYKFILLLWTPVFIIIGLGNLILFLKNIPSVSIDAFRKKKEVIQFYPVKYSLPEFEKYYFKTQCAELAFAQVSYDTYCSLSETEMLLLEVAPMTKQVLNIKEARSGATIDLIR